MNEIKLAIGVWIIMILRAFFSPLVWVFQDADFRMFNYLAEDRALNAFLGGDKDECVSARAERCNWVIRRALINWMFADPNHCRAAYENELKRKKEYSNG